jgi:hypothetical protein
VFELLDSPDNVVAIRAVGTIEKRDYVDVLAPAVDKLIERYDALRVVIVLDDDWKNFAISAGWQDTKLGIGHITKWKRCAVVTNHDWVRHGTGLFGWMIPGEVKVFEPTELADALTWAAADT